MSALKRDSVCYTKSLLSTWTQFGLTTVVSQSKRKRSNLELFLWDLRNAVTEIKGGPLFFFGKN